MKRKPMFTLAQRVALVGLYRCGGAMVIEIEDVKSMCAIVCLSKCIEPGWVTHEQVTDASGLFSLTRFGRSAAIFLAAMQGEP